MPSIPWPFGGKSENRPSSKEQQKPVIAEVQNEVAKVQQEVAKLPPETLIVGAFTIGAATSVGLLACYKRYFKRIPNSDWITPNILGRKRWIKGMVTSVGDADNFRLYHTPGLGWRWPLKFRRVPSKSKDLRSPQTIHIRIAGVDAPEAAHFGKPSQPFAADALQWLKAHVEGKTLYCQLHRRDQYGRVVAVPLLPPRILPSTFFGKSLALEMLRAGWVQVYEQAGAEYGRWGKDEFLRIQAEAQAARRGIWKNGINIESPAEYKKRYAGGGAEAEAPEKPVAEKPGLLRRVFGAFVGPRSKK